MNNESEFIELHKITGDITIILTKVLESHNVRTGYDVAVYIKPLIDKINDLLTNLDAKMLKLTQLNNLMSEIIKRFPFCPDHRDKVRDEPCQRCLVEYLTKKIDKLQNRR